MTTVMEEKKMHNEIEYGVWVETLINSGGDFDIEHVKIFNNKENAVQYYSTHRALIVEHNENDFRSVVFIEDTNILSKYKEVAANEEE